MNSLAFNPDCEFIQEWKDIYLNEQRINIFQQIIDTTYMYLEVINTNKNKALNDARDIDDLKNQYTQCCLDVQTNKRQVRQSIFQVFEQKQNIQQGIHQVSSSKKQFVDQYNHNIKKIIESESISKLPFTGELNDLNLFTVAYNKVQFHAKITICENHLKDLKVQTIAHYHIFLLEQIKLIEAFLKFKLEQLNLKQDKLNNYLTNISVKEAPSLKIIYDNLYIEAEYLKKLLDTNIKIISEHLMQKQFSSEGKQILQMKQLHLSKLKKYMIKINDLKQQLRQIYFNNFKKKPTKRIKDHHKLEKLINEEIAVNKQEYVKNKTRASYFNGLAFGVLTVMLGIIIVIRQLNYSTLSESDTYLTRFRIWRGASYFIFFNWVVAIVTLLWTKMRVNYRMVLIEDDTYVPKYQAFFQTATLLSAIYLILFAISLIQELGIIENNPFIQNLGFYMWIINLIFLFNPLKIFNYEGRRYFIKLFIKILLSPFRPMNLNLLFLAMIIGSFIQPFSDFAFTVCQAVYQQQRDCQQQTLLTTYIFTQMFLIYRFVQSIRLHIQMGGDKIFSRPIYGLSAVIFTTNTVIAAFLFNLYNTERLQIYWIVSACISCLVGSNADLRADWGFFSYDKQDWVFRKYKQFPRKVYFIFAGVDIVLNIGWALTISNNLAQNIGMNPIYYLMILAYVQLMRKGMWMFFRVEDDHCTNVGTLTAVLDDSHYYVQIEQKLKIKNDNAVSRNQNKRGHQIIFQIQPRPEAIKVSRQKKVSNIQSKNISLQSAESNMNQTSDTKMLEQIQEMVVEKNIHIASVQLLLSELKGYLKVIHQIYANLNWEDLY